MRYDGNHDESSTRLRFGKYAGCRISEIPLGYISWLFDEGSIDNELRNKLRREIAGRIGATLELEPMTRSLPAPNVNEAARQIITSGYRRISLERHPDRGGDHHAMVAATDARDYLLRAVEHGVAT